MQFFRSLKFSFLLEKFSEIISIHNLFVTSSCVSENFTSNNKKFNGHN